MSFVGACVCLLLVAGGFSPLQAAAPWWDDYPLIVETSDISTALAHHGTIGMNGSQNDPGWGIYGQKVTAFPWVRSAFDAEGLKSIGYFETYGTWFCFIAELLPPDGGDWRPIGATHWDWETYAGGETGWISAHNFFDDHPFARPWTRTHARYGGPAMTYPDGTTATGYDGAATDPRNSRVADAGASKDLWGNLAVVPGYNDAVNAIDPGTGLPYGPLDGLIYIPEDDQYASFFSIGKDSLCPMWTSYTYASALHAADGGLNGMWTDNFSAYDSLGNPPISRGFGDWSVARFRDYLAAHFTTGELAAMGVADVATFDIRATLRAQAVAWGGNAADTDPDHWAWRDERWRDHELWQIYLVYKRQAGTQALDDYYRVVKQAAYDAGQDEFLVAGNDVPIFNLGWARGNLDMVSTELSAGWNLASGSRGFMLPPQGRMAPVYKLAREHAKSRFVNLWYYIDDYPQYLNHSGLTATIYYEMLAAHALPMLHPHNEKSIGNPTVNAAFFEFVGNVKDAFGAREPTANVGLFHSSSSILHTLAPGGFYSFDNQPHAFAFWGWATALEELHVPYRALPEWKCDRAALDALELLIVPNADVIAPEIVTDVIAPWVQDGGRLIVSGECGTRLGEADHFAPHPPTGSTSFDTLLADARTDPHLNDYRWDFDRDLEGWSDRHEEPWGARGMRISHSPADGGKLVCTFDGQSTETWRPRFFQFDVPSGVSGRYLQFRYRVQAVAFNDVYAAPHWGRFHCAFAVNYNGTEVVHAAPMSPVMGEWTTAVIDFGGGGDAPVGKIELTMGDTFVWDHFPAGSTIEFDWIRLSDDPLATAWHFDGADVGPWNNTWRFYAFGEGGLDDLELDDGVLNAAYSDWFSSITQYSPFLYNSDVHLNAKAAPTAPLYAHVRLRLSDDPPTAVDPVVELSWDEGGDPTGRTTQTLPNDGQWHTLTFDVAGHPAWGTSWRTLAGGWRLTLGGSESQWQLFSDAVELDYVVFDAKATPPDPNDGRVVRATASLGGLYFTLENERNERLQAFRTMLETALEGRRHRLSLANTDSAPRTLGLTVYEDPGVRRLFIDAHNLLIDVDADATTPTQPVTFTVRKPDWVRGADMVLTSVVAPDGAPPSVGVEAVGHAHLKITLGPVADYAGVILEGAIPNPATAWHFYE